MLVYIKLDVLILPFSFTVTLTLTARGPTLYVIIWRLYKDGPRTERIKIFLMAETHNIGIQTKQKELAKTFMMILNWEKPSGLHGLYKLF